MTYRDALDLLGLTGAEDPKEVRRAYLRMVKAHPPEADPEGFQRVRMAFELLSSRVQAPTARIQKASEDALPKVFPTDAPKHPPEVTSAADPVRPELLLLQDAIAAETDPRRRIELAGGGARDFGDAPEFHRLLLDVLEASDASRNVLATATRTAADQHPEFLERLATRFPALLRPEEVARLDADLKAGRSRLGRDGQLALYLSRDEYGAALELLEQWSKGSDVGRESANPSARLVITCVLAALEKGDRSTAQRAAECFDRWRAWAESTGALGASSKHAIEVALLQELVSVRGQIGMSLTRHLARGIARANMAPASYALHNRIFAAKWLTRHRLRAGAPTILSLLDQHPQNGAAFGNLLALAVLMLFGFARAACNQVMEREHSTELAVLPPSSQLCLMGTDICSLYQAFDRAPDCVEAQSALAELARRAETAAQRGPVILSEQARQRAIAQIYDRYVARCETTRDNGGTP